MSRIDAIDKPHLSWSQVQMFMKCPRCWFHKYIEKIPMRPLYIMASGSAVHKGLELHNTELIKGGRGLSAKDMVEAAVTELECKVQNEGELDVPVDKAKDKLVADALPALSHYRAFTERDVIDCIEGVEQEVWFQVAGEDFLGYVDLVTSAGIIDYKLVGRMKAGADVKYDGQLTLYTEHLKKPAGFLQMVRRKEQAQWTPQEQAPHERAGVLDAIASTVLAIRECKKSGVFPRCDPRQWWCGERCPFSRLCFPST